MGDLPGPGSGRARPPFAGAPNCCYTPIQRQTLTTEEYTLSLPLSCLKSGTTSQPIGCHVNVITVVDRQGKELFSANAVQRESHCYLEIGERFLLPWQFSRLVLEKFFFGDPD